MSDNIFWFKKMRFFYLLIFLAIFSGCNNFKAWIVKEFMRATLADGLARASIPDISFIVLELENYFYPKTEDLNNPDREIQINPGDEEGRGEIIITVKNKI